MKERLYQFFVNSRFAMSAVLIGAIVTLTACESDGAQQTTNKVTVCHIGEKGDYITDFVKGDVTVKLNSIYFDIAGNRIREDPVVFYEGIAVYAPGLEYLEGVVDGAGNPYVRRTQFCWTPE